MIGAGPLANVIACFAILTAVALYGLPVAVPVVQSVLTKSPAAATGLRAGDRVVSINGRHLGRERHPQRDRPTPRAATSRWWCSAHGHRVTLRTEHSKVIDGAYRLGFQFGTTNRPYSVMHAPTFAAQRDVDADDRHGARARRHRHAEPGARSCTRRSASCAYSAQAEQAGATDYLVLLAFISLSLAIFNLLPFLPLDGGHVLMIALERIRGKMVSRAVFERVSVLGIMLMALLFVVGLQNDLSSILNSQPH